MNLVIQNLNKQYGNGVHALNNVSLTINKGLFGLLGPNGAGKSSLMRTLATLQDVDSGTAFLGELDVLNDKENVTPASSSPSYTGPTTRERRRIIIRRRSIIFI